VTVQDKKTVLIVDDEFSIVAALTEILAWEGYEVRTAGNGKDALELLRRERVDAVLLDVMMPVMDGVQTYVAIDADPALHGIPVILMSAARIPDRPGGWVAALRKPFDVQTLLAILARVIRPR
jgi:CheY-like chemotaxis protein